MSEGEFPLRSFWGGVPPSEVEKMQFLNSIRCIPFANILLKTIIHFQWNIGYFQVNFSHLSCLDAFVRHYTFLAIKKMGVSEGELPLRSWKKNAIFKLNLQNLVHIFCQHFAENPLFFSNEILAVIMSILPTFPFFFYGIGYYHDVYSSNVSCFNAFAELL